MNKMQIQKLKGLRAKKGFSQEALAEKIGVSRQTVSNWESGASEPDIDNLMALAKLYGITVDELIKPDDTQTRYEEKREDYFNMDTDEEDEPKSRAASFPFPVIVVIVFFMLGFVLDLWHPGWMIFLTIPLYYYIVTWVEHRQNGSDKHWMELFPFPILVVVAFFVIAFLTNVWHPTWMIFLTIPVYFFVAHAIKLHGQGKNPMLFISYPLLVTIVFLLLGFFAGAWAWAWVLFLTIPLWNWFVGKGKNSKDDETYNA